MSVSKDNRPVDYTLNDITLGRSYSVRSLGIQVSSNLRPREQCIIARNTAKKILGFIVINRSSEVILRLYLALIRSHLDYAAQFCSPYYKKDIGSLEAVQRRMTKMIQGLRYLPYKNRLKRLNFHSLERRRGVLIWVNGINKGNIDQVLEISSQDRTRGNGYKVEKLRFKTDLGRYWFTNRVE